MQNEVYTEFTLFEFPVTLQSTDELNGSNRSRADGMGDKGPVEKLKGSHE